MKRISLLSFSLLVFSFLYSQDTITVMTYNLLNYPNFVPERSAYMKEIIQYALPDIFICSELNSDAGAITLLNDAFNENGITHYQKANFVNGPDTDNMLIYNSDKLTLFSQHQIETDLRDISRYTLYTCEATDTVWFDVFSAHLKAGSTASDATDRYNEAVVLCGYFNSMPDNTNIIVGGDFNFYGSSASTEPAWNKLTVNCSIPLIDPINSPGAWHSNSLFKNIHTQSTRSNTNSGCCNGTTGGLDDRFDFLLINQHLKTGSAGAQYIPNSYKALGNDGNHLNKAIIESPTNTSVPPAVVNALFEMSDHLPVMMKVAYCGGTIGIEENKQEPAYRAYIQLNEVVLEATLPSEKNTTITMYDMKGNVVYTSEVLLSAGTHTLHIPVTLPAGIYVLNISSAGHTWNQKLMKD